MTALLLAVLVAGPQNDLSHQLQLVRQAYKNVRSSQMTYSVVAPGVKESDGMTFVAHVDYQKPDSVAFKLSANDGEVLTFITKANKTVYIHNPVGGDFTLSEDAQDSKEQKSKTEPGSKSGSFEMNIGLFFRTAC